MFRSSLVALLLVGLNSGSVRADRYDATLRLLGYGSEPIDTVIDGVLLSGSQRLAERLLSRMPSVHPRSMAFRNDRDRLELALLANPERLNMAAPDRNMSLLEAAVGSNSTDVIRFLLEREIDGKNEKPQLERAVNENRIDVVGVFCEFERLEPLLATALHDACWKQHREIAKRIIATGVDVTEARSWGFQAVHAAAFGRDTEMVDLLLSRGAEVDVFVAAGLGRLAQMNTLLEGGIPKEFKNSVGPHPAYFAARSGELTTLQPFLGNRSVITGTGHRRFNLLVAAAETGSAEVIERLLSAGVSRDAKGILFDDQQAHALHFAAAAGNLPAVRVLLKAGVEIDVTTERGSTPLCLAIDFGRLEVAQYLLKEGADVDAPRNKTESPLWIAAGEGRLDAVKLLHDSDAKIDGIGKSPLRNALSQGRVEVAELLLERGSNRLATTADAVPEKVLVTPLGLAATRDTRLVRMFLDLGEDPNRLQGDPSLEITPVVQAVQGFKVRNALLLLEAGGRVRPLNHTRVLYFAGRNGDRALVAALLDAGVSLGSKSPTGTEDGLQALVRGAIQADRQDVLRYLSSLGINLDMQLTPIDSPLGMAALVDARQCLIALLESGCDPNTPPFPKARSPIELAMNRTSFHPVRILVEHGAKPSHTGGEHLVTAAIEGDVEHVRYLLELGYGVNGPNDMGKPLAVAATNGRLEVVELLLERGANVNLRDAAGQTALHGVTGADQHGLEILERLLAERADPNLADNDRGLPLHLAIAKRRTDLVERLVPVTTERDIQLSAALGEQAAVAAALRADAAVLREERAPLGTPIFWAAAGGQSEVVKFLLKSGGATKEFFDAMPRIVEYGDADLVEFLAAHGVSVNGPANLYGEPLTIAINARRPDLVRALLKHRANPNAARGVNGWTPLQRAATRGMPIVTRMLLEAGAHVNGVGYNQGTALDLALNPSAFATRPGENTGSTRGTVEDKLEVARILLNTGARGRAGNPGKVAYAAQLGEVELVERLLATGDDPNGVHPTTNRTPLVSAIEVRLLRTRGIVDRAEREQRERDYVTIVEKLLAAGADPSLVSELGGTPLSAAVRVKDTVLERIIRDAIAAKESR